MPSNAFYKILWPNFLADEGHGGRFQNSEEKEELLSESSDDYQHPPPTYQTRFWIAATSFFAITTLILVVLFTLKLYNENQPHRYGSFDRGFVTEISNGFREIELEQVQFTGGLKYDERGHLYRNVDPSQPQYVGEPSPDMDKAWDDLIHDRYVAFHGTEYQGPDLGDLYQWPPHNTYRIGVDVLHSLHCLRQDRIRKVLDKEYYAEELASEEGPHGKMHVDHCIDYIRQMLQCKADLTPLPVYWAEGANRTVPDFDVVHTCRNFRKIRDWSNDQERRTMKNYPT